jgi:hypothetical protein
MINNNQPLLPALLLSWLANCLTVGQGGQVASPYVANHSPASSLVINMLWPPSTLLFISTDLPQKTSPLLVPVAKNTNALESMQTNERNVVLVVKLHVDLDINK